MKHLLRTKELSKQEILEIIERADKYLDTVKNRTATDELKGKVLATLFYEPSTRTRLSTETAMLRLGGSVISAVGEENSSLSKGETLYDTAKMVSNFANIIAIRHSRPGSALEFAEGASVPVINCGDGPADHPTQALLDAYTIYKHYGRLDGLTVAFAGDLKNGRTAHGLMALLSNFDVKFNLASPPELKLSDEYKVGQILGEFSGLEEAVKGADVVYSTRVQKERFTDMAEYEKLKAVFIFNRKFLEDNCPDAILLHALPRIDEITRDADDWKGAKYFDAVSNGVAVRMALLTKLLCS